MSIEFRRQKGPAATDQQKPPSPPIQLWIPPASKGQVEERLFHFLGSVRNGRPQVGDPLLVEKTTLRALYTSPHPDLLKALQYCLDRFLIELGLDAADLGALDVSPAILGVALATYNCIWQLPGGMEATVEDPVAPFVSALIETLPPARTLSEMLAYHALLHHTAEALPALPPGRATALQALINRSPLSALYHLHLHTPPPLTALAAKLWPWWRRRVVNPAPWTSRDDWLETLAPLLAQPAIVTFLRRRWLALPDTRETCRNLGLLLESLRLWGGYRALILEFYEAYDFFRAVIVQDAWHGTVLRRWPALDHTERLLRADGDTEAAIQLNRVGHEYFQQFRPLVNIIIAENGPPNDYRHLKLDLIRAVRRLLDITTDYTPGRLDLSKGQFSSEDAP